MFALRKPLPGLKRALSSSHDVLAADPLVARLTQYQLEVLVPKAQPYYTFTDSQWKALHHGHTPGASATREVHKTPQTAITNLRIITWNIDFMAPQPQARMASALSHLQTLVEDTPTSTAVAIMLQEIKQDTALDLACLGKDVDPSQANDLAQLAQRPWVQGYHITDLTSDPWSCEYNSVTLVDRRLSIASVARLPFVSRFGREALLVDIALRRASTDDLKAPADGKAHQVKRALPPHQPCSILRLCNVHLDSLAGKPPLRPVQWRACAKYLQDKSHGVVAGILAGDCNPNEHYDRTIPQENGFKDAYIELGGREDDPEGYTWGPQTRRTGYSPKRMDKICFCQQGAENEPLSLKKLVRFGIGVKVEDKAASNSLKKKGYYDFVTDHFGLMADFELGKSWTFSTTE